MYFKVTRELFYYFCLLSYNIHHSGILYNIMTFRSCSIQLKRFTFYNETQIFFIRKQFKYQSNDANNQCQRNL